MKQTRPRDSRKSRADILQAAEAEFSGKGLYGARVDEIARSARINKRMIYEYFGSKEELYKAVLVEVYSRLGRKELQLLHMEGTCVDKIRDIIRLYFEFLSDNPTYVNLILWENLNKGRYISQIDFSEIKKPTFDLLRDIIEQGKRNGCFRADLDAGQMILSILMYTFSYFSNRYTLSVLLDTKLDDPQRIRERADNVIGMFLNHMCNQ